MWNRDLIDNLEITTVLRKIIVVIESYNYKNRVYTTREYINYHVPHWTLLRNYTLSRMTWHRGQTAASGNLWIGYKHSYHTYAQSYTPHPDSLFSYQLSITTLWIYEHKHIMFVYIERCVCMYIQVWLYVCMYSLPSSFNKLVQGHMFVLGAQVTWRQKHKDYEF